MYHIIQYVNIFNEHFNIFATSSCFTVHLLFNIKIKDMILKKVVKIYFKIYALLKFVGTYLFLYLRRTKIYSSKNCYI